MLLVSQMNGRKILGYSLGNLLLEHEWIRNIQVFHQIFQENLVYQRRIKKKSMENSIKVGGWGQHYISLKHMILPKKQFKKKFSSIFDGGRPSSATIMVGCEASRRAIWQLSDDPYHTDFVSWQGGGGQTFSGKFHKFFFLL